MQYLQRAAQAARCIEQYLAPRASMRMRLMQSMNAARKFF